MEPAVAAVNVKLDSSAFVNKHKTGKKAFTRNRVLTFRVLATMLMTNLQKSIQRELSLFTDAITLDGGSIPEVSKAAFTKARAKLRYTAFEELAQVVADEFYKSSVVQYWKGYRIIGVDGSTVELPNSKVIEQHYGVHCRRKDGKATCMGRTLMIYDTLNNMTLAGALGNITESESEMLWKLLPGLEFKRNDLYVFDRFYASHLLIFYLQHRGAQFCFRMKKNWWKVIETFYTNGSSSSVITLHLPNADEQEATRLEISCRQLQCRLTRVELDSGETEILLSSLIDEQLITPSDTKELYALRWPIEEAYKSFKHKVCIENFSGLTTESLLQDFFVKILIMNLTATAIRPINEGLKKPAVKVKYTHQANIIETVAALKRAVVSFFIFKETSKALKRLYHRILKTTEPIRPGRKFKRNHQPKRKYYKNYKPV